MLGFIDKLVNSITMYRLILYYVFGLIVVALIESSLGVLAFKPFDLAASVFVITVVCVAVNYVFAKVYEVPANIESVYITAFILALIITPPIAFERGGFLFLMWASVLAMASKYILAIDKKHIFNPAAIAVAITSFALQQPATWWIGTLPMLAFVVVGGILITRKIHRFDLVLSFFAAACVSTIALTFSRTSPLISVERLLSNTGMVFFACVMLTEPLTTPSTRSFRLGYGVLTGILFAPFLHIGYIFSTPELALCVGNIYSYIVSPKGKRVLTLIERKEIANGTWNFWFKPDRAFSFKPGQYVEWTFGYENPDNRGNRRYFTLASSPTEETVQLGIKCYTTCSSYKKALLQLQPGEKIIISQLSGDFTLDKAAGNATQKLAFIAGGIGITPFRSMIKYMTDTKDKRDTVLFYSNKTEEEIAYRDVFDDAEKTIGAKIVYNLSAAENIVDTAGRVLNGSTKEKEWKGERGSLTSEMISRNCPDYRERMFYISGPHGMVVAFTDTLKKMGVPSRHIVVDFFPGF